MGLVRGVVVATVHEVGCGLSKSIIGCMFVRVITELDVIRQFFRL
jgi:hypothetical protein